PGGEHLGRERRGGGGEGDGDVLLEGTEGQGLDIGLDGFFPEQGVFTPAREAFGAPAAPEKHEAGGECEEKGDIAGRGEQERRDGGEVDHPHGGAEEQHPDHLFTGKVGASEGQLAPIAEEAFETKKGDEGAERGDQEGAKPAEDGDGGGQAGKVHGGDAADDDEALHGGEPGGTAFLVGSLEHPVGLEVNRQGEQVAQAQDHEDGEAERRGDGHESVHAFVVEGNGRGTERGLDHPAEREAGVGEQQQAVNAAARQGFPGEGEGGLLARVGDPPLQQAGTEPGVSAGAGRRGFEQQFAVAVVAEQIGANGDDDGQDDGEQGGGGGGSARNDAFP